MPDHPVHDVAVIEDHAAAEASLNRGPCSAHGLVDLVEERRKAEYLTPLPRPPDHLRRSAAVGTSARLFAGGVDATAHEKAFGDVYARANVSARRPVPAWPAS